MNPAARSARARLAAHTRWSRCEDRAAATEPARRAYLDRWENQVDPDHTLPADIRARLAKSARAAHMSRMSMRRHSKH